MHAVIADLESTDTGSFFFSGLEVEQKPIGVFAQRAQFVQFFVVAGGDHAAIANQYRRRFDDGAFQQLPGVGMFSGQAAQAAQQIRLRVRQDLAEPGQPREAVAELRQVPGSGRFQRDP